MFKTFYRGNADLVNKFGGGQDEEDWSDEEDDEVEGPEGEAAEYGGGGASTANDTEGQRRRFKVN